MKTDALKISILLFALLLLPCCGGGGKGFGLEPYSAKVEKRTEGPLSVMVVGDTMLDDLALPYIKKYGYDYPLAGVRDMLLQSDIVNVNLEVAVADKCDRAGLKKFAYYMKPQALASFADAGVNVACLANNHVLDCKEEGLEAGLRYLDQYGIAHYGAGFGDDRHRGLVVDVDGTKVGFAGFYSRKPEFRKAGTAHVSEQNVAKIIADVRKHADVVIATFHWGKNYQEPVDNSQKKYGRIAIDAGADAVIGHHPHIPQAIGMYKGRPIVYSVGNFAFATGNNKAKSGLAARLIVDDGKLSRLELIPLFLQARNKKVLWQTKPAKGKAARSILNKLIRVSAKHGCDLNLEEEKAVIDL